MKEPLRKNSTSDAYYAIKAFFNLAKYGYSIELYELKEILGFDLFAMHEAKVKLIDEEFLVGFETSKITPYKYRLKERKVQ